MACNIGHSKIVRSFQNLMIKYKLRKLNHSTRFKPGDTDIMGWKIHYIDGPSLASSIEILVLKQWNNFQTKKDNPIIMDCGANIGISVLNYKKEYPHAIITCFEPDPEAYRALSENLERNGGSDVNAIEAAVWTKNGEMNFFCEGADGGRLLDQKVECNRNIMVVKTVDLSQFLDCPIDLLKIDIEGAEYDIIPHIQDKMYNVQNIIIECHINYSTLDKFVNILTILSKENYELFFNTYGPWRDLVHRPHKLPNEFDQYVLIAATKKDAY